MLDAVYIFPAQLLTKLFSLILTYVAYIADSFDNCDNAGSKKFRMMFYRWHKVFGYVTVTV